MGWYSKHSNGSTNETLFNGTGPGDGGDFSFNWTLLAIFPCTLIITATIVGNLLVIISVICFRQLRRPNNFFLVSLAVADLLVGVTAMPLKLAQEVTGGVWIYGQAFCYMFTANDILFTTASTTHLACISMDRYTAILHPLKYGSRFRSTRVAAMIAAAWLIAIVISYSPVVFDQYMPPGQTAWVKMETREPVCSLHVSRWYTFLSSSLTFWIPLAVMTITYSQIYHKARAQESELFAVREMLYMQALRTMRKHGGGEARSDEQSILKKEIGSDGDDAEEDKRIESMRKTSRRLSIKSLKRENRAAKVLGVLMGMFFFSLTPFFLWYTLSFGICPDTCQLPENAEFVRSILFWCGYLNSCMNPIVYAMLNRDMRCAFKKLMRFTYRCFIRKSGPMDLDRDAPLGDAELGAFCSDELESAAEGEDFNLVAFLKH